MRQSWMWEAVTASEAPKIETIEVEAHDDSKLEYSENMDTPLRTIGVPFPKGKWEQGRRWEY